MIAKIIYVSGEKVSPTYTATSVALWQADDKQISVWRVQH